MWKTREIGALACGAAAAALMGVLSGGAMRVPRPADPVTAAQLDFSQVNGPPIWPTDEASLVPPPPFVDHDAMAAVYVPKDEAVADDADLEPAGAEVERVSADMPADHGTDDAAAPAPPPIQPEAKPAPERDGGSQAALSADPAGPNARLLASP